MDILGMLFVGGTMGLAAYYFYPWPKGLRLRICILMGTIGASLTGIVAQMLLGYREGSMRSFCVILLGALVFIVMYIWSRRRGKS